LKEMKMKMQFLKKKKGTKKKVIQDDDEEEINLTRVIYKKSLNKQDEIEKKNKKSVNKNEANELFNDVEPSVKVQPKRIKKILQEDDEKESSEDPDFEKHPKKKI